jgi:hypothetical protein
MTISKRPKAFLVNLCTIPSNHLSFPKDMDQTKDTVVNAPKNVPECAGAELGE